MIVTPTHITEFLKFQEFVDELQRRLIAYERSKIAEIGCCSLLHDNFRPCLYAYAAHVFFGARRNQKERPMPDTMNALAELAVRLGTDALSLGADKYPEIEKAQRIVAELAKADTTYIADPVHNNICHLSYDAFRKCRAIAEEGEGDGN